MIPAPWMTLCHFAMSLAINSRKTAGDPPVPSPLVRRAIARAAWSRFSAKTSHLVMALTLPKPLECYGVDCSLAKGDSHDM